MISKENIAIIIFNHELNEKAIQLKQRFIGNVDVFLFDSGSQISNLERQYFDKAFENIYYNGLLNATNEFLKKQGYEIGVIITSDVEISNIGIFLDKIRRAFEKEEIGVYAPSAEYSFHHHMIYNKSNSVQQVSFTEGFCFAFRSNILNEMCPVDIKLNKFGYGTDVILGYHALDQGFISAVDHSYYVNHPYGSGYDKQAAIKAKHNWLASLPKPQQWFYKIATKSIFKNTFGVFVLNLIFRK
ncbi:hypothetical protein [Gracilimonas sp. BCB1]|uniref:hypothetical protein n=1 Tax=Gracilimonas sp. BCB1 TaxID=3152362 RepID=UPI0032D8F513